MLTTKKNEQTSGSYVSTSFTRKSDEEGYTALSIQINCLRPGLHGSGIWKHLLITDATWCSSDLHSLFLPKLRSATRTKLAASPLTSPSSLLLTIITNNATKHSSLSKWQSSWTSYADSQRRQIPTTTATSEYLPIPKLPSLSSLLLGCCCAIAVVPRGTRRIQEQAYPPLHHQTSQTAPSSATNNHGQLRHLWTLL